MAFNDLPQIDRYSVNSEKSERALERLLDQDAGFICRKDVPDKGCDYDIELITDQKNASGWRFALQLKSVENITLISNNEYVSYSFETSRLGYLMKRIPSMGIIAIYSIESDKIYFDYVDKIYNRLMEERDSDDWKANDKVNIRISIANVLNSSNVVELRQIFLNRFSQASIMQASHGKKYGLPATNITGEVKYDWNNLDDIKKMLIEYGVFLINSFDLHIPFTLISELSNKEIFANQDLLRIASVAYCEAGMFVEAELYNNKLSKTKGLTADDNLMIEYVGLRIAQGLGRITHAEFIEKTKAIVSKEQNEQNGIMLEINLIFFELLELKSDGEQAARFEQRIRNVFSRITSCNTISNEVKLMLKIWNAENYGIMIDSINYNEIIVFRMREGMGIETAVEDRAQKIQKIIERDHSFLTMMQSLNEEAKGEKSQLAGAYLRSIISRNLLSKEIANIGLDIKMQSADHQRLLHSRVSMALEAFYTFNFFNHYREAYTSLCDSMELIEVSRNYYLYNDTFELQKLSENKHEMENKFDFPHYRPIVRKFIESSKINQETKYPSGDYTFLKNLTDNHLALIARHIQKAQLLDAYCFNNILNELKGYRLFATRCNNENIEILQSNKSQYQEPVIFMLRSRITGITSGKSSSVEELLEQWGL